MLPSLLMCTAQSEKARLGPLTSSKVNLMFWAAILMYSVKASTYSVLILTRVVHKYTPVAGSSSCEGGQGSALHFLNLESGYYGWHWWAHGTARFLSVETSLKLEISGQPGEVQQGRHGLEWDSFCQAVCYPVEDVSSRFCFCGGDESKKRCGII